MTLVLLDTNAYLRLALRVRPLLGIKFGQKDYVLTILKDVEDEVHRNADLRLFNPWFDDRELADERMAARMRFSDEEKERLRIATTVLHGHVQTHIGDYKNSPPSRVDCRVLAFGQIRESIVVTDDLGMHTLAADFGIQVWHGFDLLRRMKSAKMIDNDKIREIYDALERNGDLTQTWVEAKHTVFVKVFGKAPD